MSSSMEEFDFNIRSPEKVAYWNARNRCESFNTKDWENYGSRGIKFKFKSFKQWFAELGRRPSKNHTVERINNNGHYEPGNVRWATRAEQNHNKRKVADTSCMSAAASKRCTPAWRKAVSRRVKKQHREGKFGRQTWKSQ